MKKIALITLYCFSVTSAFAIDCSNYPHWSNCAANPQLIKIDNYIAAHAPSAGQPATIAAFDWDGTLYNEQLPSNVPSLQGKTFAGQPTWMIYAATQFKDHPSWFPTFRTDDTDGGTTAFINANLYTEGDSTTYTLTNYNQTKTPEATPMGVYNKFVQTAAYTTGMEPKDITDSTNAYLTQYPTEKYAYLPMLDIVQHMHDLGYQTWIVTGSIPYFVAAVINNIQNNPNINYNGKPYNLGILPSGGYDPNNPGHIIGNEQKVVSYADGEQRFSQAYEDKFLQPVSPDNRFAIDHEGKAIAIQNYLEKTATGGPGLPVIFYAGNSGGDYNAASYVLNTAASGQAPGFVVAVQSQNEDPGSLLDVWNHFDAAGDVVCLPHMGNGNYAPSAAICQHPAKAPLKSR